MKVFAIYIAGLFVAVSCCQGFLPAALLKRIHKRHNSTFKMASEATQSDSRSSDSSSISLEGSAAFANTWFGAWKKRDLDEIIEPFTDDVEFLSPLVEKIIGDPSGIIHDKATLRQYFQAALDAYPKIDKEIYNVLVGVESIAVYYKSVNDMMSCEIFFGGMDDNSFRCHKVLNNYRASDTAVEESSALANAWIRAWNTRDFDSFKKHLTDNVTLTSPFLKDTSKLAKLKGKDEVVSYFELILERRKDMRFELVDSLVGKDSVAVLYDVDGESRECAGMYIDTTTTGKIKSIWSHRA